MTKPPFPWKIKTDESGRRKGYKFCKSLNRWVPCDAKVAAAHVNAYLVKV